METSTALPTMIEEELDPALTLALDVLDIALQCIPPELRHRVIDQTQHTIARHLERRFSPLDFKRQLTPAA